MDSISFRNIADRLQLNLGDVGQLDPQHCIVNQNSGFYVVSDKRGEPAPDNRLMIRRISVTGRTDSVVYVAWPGAEQDKIELTHGQNSVRIEFVLPEYTGSRNVEYSYWLEGYDDTWSRMQRNSYKEYTRLPKGTYTFHVRACNRISGKIQETEMSITVGAAWYETWAAYLAYLIIAMLAVRYIYILW